MRRRLARELEQAATTPQCVALGGAPRAHARLQVRTVVRRAQSRAELCAARCAVCRAAAPQHACARRQRARFRGGHERGSAARPAAARNGRSSPRRWLLEDLGWDVDLPTQDGTTALHFAVWQVCRLRAWCMAAGKAAQEGAARPAHRRELTGPGRLVQGHMETSHYLWRMGADSGALNAFGCAARINDAAECADRMCQLFAIALLSAIALMGAGAMPFIGPYKGTTSASALGSLHMELMSVSSTAIVTRLSTKRRSTVKAPFCTG